MSLLTFLFFAFVSHAHPFLPQMNDLLQPLSGSMNINTRIIYNRCILIYSRLMYTTLSICLGVLLSFNAKCWSFLFQKTVVPKKRFFWSLRKIIILSNLKKNQYLTIRTALYHLVVVNTQRLISRIWFFTS